MPQTGPGYNKSGRYLFKHGLHLPGIRIQPNKKRRELWTSKSSLMAISTLLKPPPPPHLTMKASPTTNKAKLDLEEAMNALEFYSLNQTKPKDPQSFYNSLINLCISNRAPHEASRLRSHLNRVNHEPDVFLNNQFINLYSKCGEPEMARDVFNGMCDRNLVSWNTMISCYCSNAHFLDSLRLFLTMLETGIMPDYMTCLAALRASAGSANFKHGEQIHGLILKNGLLLSKIEVGNALINMYSKFGKLEEAETVRKSMVEDDEITWNSLIAANSQNGRGDRALDLYVDMMNASREPDEFTFGSLLGSDEITSIKEIHSQAIKRGFASNVVTGSVLLAAYARRQEARDASLVFRLISERNIVSWNSIIAACFGNELTTEGLEFFFQMGASGFIPDKYTISTLLKAASTQLPGGTGKQLHGLAVKLGLQTDTAICNNIIMMYARNDSVSDSEKIFYNIAEPDIISWNSIAQANLENEEFEQTLTIFKQMKLSGLEPDEFSCVCALSACASLTWQGIGKQIHSNLIKANLNINAFLGSTLIDMYSKFMAVNEARIVFNGIERKDLITWNSMISGLAQNGYLDESLTTFSLMREENMKPDSFTFASLLSACANTTAMQQGKQIHALILKSTEMNIDTAAANALMMMYGRCGSINEAKNVFSETKNKNVVSWTSMISGHVQSGDSKEALKLFNEMERAGVLPNEKTFVVLLTACSYAGMAKEAEKYFNMMQIKYGLKPEFDHYACMVDILGRAGRLTEAEDLIERMPYEPDTLVWKMLLSSCRMHGDKERGKRSMEKILAIDSKDSAAYILLSNLYADLGDWDGVDDVRQWMRENGVKKEPGKSWIEVRSRVHEFRAGDNSHPQTNEIYLKVKELHEHITNEEYAPHRYNEVVI